MDTGFPCFSHAQHITETQKTAKCEFLKEVFNMSLIKWFQAGAPMNIYYLYKKSTVLSGEIEKCVPR